MKRVVCKRAWAAVLAALLCLLTLSPALALTGSYGELDGARCTLAVTYHPGDAPAEGVRFRLWRAADVSASGYTPLPFVWKYHTLAGVEGWKAKADTLYSYLLRDGVAPTAEAATDGEGVARFEDLEQGLYLLAGSSLTRGGRVYTPTPTLVCLPNSGDFYTWDTDVAITCKFTYRTLSGGSETVQRRVLKTWEDEGAEDLRPESVTVDLLRDGQVYDTVTLTAAENWRYTWEELPADGDWRVAERENGDYNVRAERQGVTFVLTNTYRQPPEEDLTGDDPPLSDRPDVDPDDPPEEQLWDSPPPQSDIPGEGDADQSSTPDNGDDPLPQTGQLWWPVLPMSLCGAALLAVGLVRRKRCRDE